MTDAQIAEIRERLAAATPGPWEFSLSAPTFRGEQYEGISAGGVMIARTLPSFAPTPGPNAALIAHAPTDLSALLAELEATRRERDALREVRGAGCQCGDEDACRFVRERDALWSILDLADGYRNTQAMDGVLDDLLAALRAAAPARES